VRFLPELAPDEQKPALWIAKSCLAFPDSIIITVPADAKLKNNNDWKKLALEQLGLQTVNIENFQSDPWDNPITAKLFPKLFFGLPKEFVPIIGEQLDLKTYGKFLLTSKNLRKSVLRREEKIDGMEIFWRPVIWSSSKFTQEKINKAILLLSEPRNAKELLSLIDKKWIASIFGVEVLYAWIDILGPFFEEFFRQLPAEKRTHELLAIFSLIAPIDEILKLGNGGIYIFKEIADVLEATHLNVSTSLLTTFEYLAYKKGSHLPYWNLRGTKWRPSAAPIPVNEPLLYGHFVGANLSDADIQGCTFPWMHFDRARFKRAKFNKVNFMGSTFVQADLTEAELTEVNLTENNLREVNFTRANFTKVEFYWTGFNGLTWDVVSGINCTGTTWSDKESLLNFQDSVLNLFLCDKSFLNYFPNKVPSEQAMYSYQNLNEIYESSACKGNVLDIPESDLDNKKVSTHPRQCLNGAIVAKGQKLSSARVSYFWQQVEQKIKHATVASHSAATIPASDPVEFCK
jgi:uncharacterized protein YjbI with pentapeptide repeats